MHFGTPEEIVVDTKLVLPLEMASNSGILELPTYLCIGRQE